VLSEVTVTTIIVVPVTPLAVLIHPPFTTKMLPIIVTVKCAAKIQFIMNAQKPTSVARNIMAGRGVGIVGHGGIANQLIRIRKRYV